MIQLIYLQLYVEFYNRKLQLEYLHHQRNVYRITMILLRYFCVERRIVRLRDNI